MTHLSRTFMHKLKQLGLGCAVVAMVSSSAQANDIAPAFDMQRCFNMGNSLESPLEGDWGAPINIADFAMIKATGIDTVRIPVRWSAHTGAGPDYVIDKKFMARVTEVVDAALAQDLNVILNVHHYEEIMQTPKAELRKLLKMWRQIGVQFADRSDDLWFETLNEPMDKLEGDIMRAAQKVAFMAIRESNPNRIVILGGSEWSGIRTLVTNSMPFDKNTIYTFHYYDPFDFTHQKAKWLGKDMPKKKRGWGSSEDRAELAEAIKTATTFREGVGRPLFLGEFGANSPIKNEDRIKWTQAVAQEMEAANIPWCLWSFSNTFEIYNVGSKKWDKDMVSALGLTVPGHK